MKLKQLFAAVSAAAIITIANLAPTHASTNFTINPVKYDLTATPGETLNETLTITNTGDEPLTFSAYATPYSIESDEYRTPNFSDRFENYNDVLDWLSYPTSTSGYLTEGQSTELPFDITVPSCATSSHQWFVLMVESVDENSDNLIPISARVGAIVNLELANNHPENCGGTAEDPNPYTLVTELDPSGEETERLYRADFLDELDRIHAAQDAALAEQQAAITEAIENPLGDLTWIIWLVLGAILAAGLILLVVFLVKNSKNSKKSSNSPTPPTPEPTPTGNNPAENSPTSEPPATPQV